MPVDIRALLLKGQVQGFFGGLAREGRYLPAAHGDTIVDRAQALKTGMNDAKLSIILDA